MTPDQRTFIVIYDTYCGWCYGAGPVLDALVATGAPVEALHRHLFQGAMAYRLAEGKGDLIMQADARIAALTGRTFSQTYIDRVVRSPDEILDSAFTAQAAALVHDQGAAKEFAVRARLEVARYVDGVSAGDRDAVVAALRAEGVSPDDAELIGTPALAARAATLSARAATLMDRTGARGVPTLLSVEGDTVRPIDHSRYYGRPEAISELVDPPVDQPLDRAG